MTHHWDSVAGLPKAFCDYSQLGLHVMNELSSKNNENKPQNSISISEKKPDCALSASVFVPE